MQILSRIVDQHNGKKFQLFSPIRTGQNVFNEPRQTPLPIQDTNSNTPTTPQFRQLFFPVKSTLFAAFVVLCHLTSIRDSSPRIRRLQIPPRRIASGV